MYNIQQLTSASNSSSSNVLFGGQIMLLSAGIYFCD